MEVPQGGQIGSKRNLHLLKLQCCVDLMSVSLPVSPISNKAWKKHPCFLTLFDLLFFCVSKEHPTDTTGLNDELSSKDEAQGLIKWMKGTPVPLMIDLSTELRDVMDKLVIDEDLLVPCTESMIGCFMRLLCSVRRSTIN